MKKVTKNSIGILITSVSKKAPLIEAVKNSEICMRQKYLVVGGDISRKVISRYFVDKFVLLPQINTRTDPRSVLSLCKDNNIAFIIPTRDNELMFWAINRQMFNNAGISVMISDTESIELTRDKLLFGNNTLLKGFPIISSYTDIDQISHDVARYVVKERYGAGADKVGLNLTKKDAISHSKLLTLPIFQPFLVGDEYSVDLYVDKIGTCQGCICRKRALVHNGESQITTTELLPQLEALSQSIAKSIGFYGHIILQVIKDEMNNFHVIEINARFGGASTLSVKAGLKTFDWFLLESQGKKITGRYSFIRHHGEITQIRYPKDKYIYHE